MAVTEDVFERLATTPGAGVGAALCAILVLPRVAPKLGRGARRLTKGVIKGALVLSRRTRAAIADAERGWVDLYVEARQELDARAVPLGDAGTREPVGAEAVEEPAPARVHLNRADREELMALPGVGERTAEKILQFRETHGPIESLEQLVDAEVVPGHVAAALGALIDV